MSSQKAKKYRLFFPSMEKQIVKSKSEEKRIILPSMNKEEVKSKSEEISEKDSVMQY